MKASTTVRYRWVGFAALTLAFGYSPSPASAAIIMDDDIAGYANGPLVGQGGWQAHSSAGSKAVQVSGGTIRLEQSSGLGEDVNKRWFVPRSATAKTYASFHLKVQPGSVIGTSTDYFAHFRPGALDTNNFETRVAIGGVDASHYSIWVNGVVIWPVALAMGNTYRIVTSYDGATGASQLWVDPAAEESASITTGADGAASGRQLESYAFRQASPPGATSFQIVNDIAVGTAFADVNRSTRAPMLDAWNFIAFAIGLALVGAVFMRSRRAVRRAA
jgi:hypothetical protein